MGRGYGCCGEEDAAGGGVAVPGAGRVERSKMLAGPTGCEGRDCRGPAGADAPGRGLGGRGRAGIEMFRLTGPWAVDWPVGGAKGGWIAPPLVKGGRRGLNIGAGRSASAVAASVAGVSGVAEVRGAGGASGVSTTCAGGAATAAGASGISGGGAAAGPGGSDSGRLSRMPVGAVWIWRSSSVRTDPSPSKRRRSSSATSSSIELECVFFSCTPKSGSMSRMTPGFTSSSRASSLILIFFIEETAS